MAQWYTRHGRDKLSRTLGNEEISSAIHKAPQRKAQLYTRHRRDEVSHALGTTEISSAVHLKALWSSARVHTKLISTMELHFTPGSLKKMYLFI